MAAVAQRQRNFPRRVAETAPAPDLGALRGPIESRLRELRTWLADSPEQGRRALSALLAGERLRVYPDAERRFRVEGSIRLGLELDQAQASGPSGVLGSAEPRSDLSPHGPQSQGVGTQGNAMIPRT